MKKLLLFLVILVLIVAGGVFYLASQGGNLVQAGIEKYTPPLIGTDVQVGGVSLNILGGSASVSDFRIENPPQFSDNAAFSVGKLTMALDAVSLLSDTVIIRSVDVARPQIRLEVTDQGANLDVLRRNALEAMERYFSGETEATKSVMIERLTIRDADITATSPLIDDSVSFQIPEIVLTELGGTNAADTATIAARVTQAIYEAVAGRVTSEQIRNQLKNLGADPDKLIDQIEEDVQGLEGELSDKAKKKLEGVLGR